VADIQVDPEAYRTVRRWLAEPEPEPEEPEPEPEPQLAGPGAEAGAEVGAAGGGAQPVYTSGDFQEQMAARRASKAVSTAAAQVVGVAPETSAAIAAAVSVGRSAAAAAAATTQDQTPAAALSSSDDDDDDDDDDSDDDDEEEEGAVVEVAVGDYDHVVETDKSRARGRWKAAGWAAQRGVVSSRHTHTDMRTRKHHGDTRYSIERTADRCTTTTTTTIVMLSVPFYCQAALRYTTTAAGRGTDL
jgi:hypothetical protein